MDNKNRALLDFFHESEGLKTLLRHSWLSNNRQESVAEHSWRMALMAIVFEKEISMKVDMLKVLKMIIIHDLAEIRAGDHHAFKGELKNKFENEKNALEKILKNLPAETREEIKDLWLEFEDLKTDEAKFARAMDKLEVLIQHNEAELKTWDEKEFSFNLECSYKEVEFNKVLFEFRETLQEEIKKKIDSGE